MSQKLHDDDEDPRVALRKKAERANQVHSEDIKWLMGAQRGRRIVWRQLESALVFHQTFNTNAMQMAFAEGRRSTGLDLLAYVMKSCPEQYMTMTTENSSNDHRNNPSSDK